MTHLTIGLSMFGAMLLMMGLRIPIAASMFIPGAIGYWSMTNEITLLNVLKGSSVARLTLYELSVIPLFLLMGQFATQGGLSRALFNAASAFVGHIRGGVAMASLMAAGAFGAVCGSSVATAATITQVAYPEMKRLGYQGSMSTGTLAAGGTLGILIPPSVPLVVYGILTEQSIGKLFAAAMVPGLMALLGYLAVVALICRFRPVTGPATGVTCWPQRWKSLVDIWPIMTIFIVVFGGIYGGLFSPTEGAAVGAVLTLAAAVMNRKMTWNSLWRSCTATAETSAMVFLIFLGADMMNAALALTQMPADVAAWVTAQAAPPVLIIGAILAMYVLLGCVMDELSMLLLTIPVIFPAVMGLELFGLNQEMKAIWFGILVLMTLSIGMLAPPVGLNVYVVNSLVKEVPMTETYKGVFPFLIWDAMRLVLLLVFPVIALGFVQLLFAR